MGAKNSNYLTENDLKKPLMEYLPKELSNIVIQYYDPVPFVIMKTMLLSDIDYFKKKYINCCGNDGCKLIKVFPIWMNMYEMVCENDNHMKLYDCTTCRKFVTIDNHIFDYRISKYVCSDCYFGYEI